MTNLNKLLENKLISFDDENEVYFIQIFKRRKDHPNLEHNVVRLKCYTVCSQQEFDELYPKIVYYCEEHKARAYIRLNKQNIVDMSLRCINQMSTNLRLGNYHKNINVWNSIAGQGGNEDYWVIDVDWEHINHNMLITQEIKNSLEYYFKEVRKQALFFVKLQTKTGYHLIVKPFDIRIMKDININFSKNNIPNIQIQKDANTLLYF